MTSRLPVLLVTLTLTVAACVDGGAGEDQVVRPPSPDPTPSASAAPTDPTPTPSPATPSPTPPDGDADGDGDDAAQPPVDGPLAHDVLAANPPDEPVRFTVALHDPTSPAEVVEQIVASEQAVRDTSLSDDARLVAAHRGQRAYRLLGRRTAWRDEVLAELPERWRPIAAGNIAARDALDRLRAGGDVPTEMPAWEVVEPEPADDLLTHYREAEEQIGSAWEILAAINLVETRMGRIVGFSTAGARGPMQFIPASWDAFGAGGDIDDARDSILAAARHLTQRPGDPPTDRNALLNYNRSSDYGDAVLAIAEVLREDPGAYRAYHGWQVYYTTPEHEFLLPVGYREPDPVDIDEYLTRPALDVAG